nr:hypothetical protein [Tanacetum cinerariifolium]
MPFMLSGMSVMYVLTTPMPEDRGEYLTVEQNVETSKELWDTLEAKYMAEDASSKKFLVSNFTNYKMTDPRPVLEQYNELLGILRRFTQHQMNMDESIQVSCIIDKLPRSWKDFKHTLKHLKEELTLIELGSHLRIEESFRVQDSDKPKGNNVVGPSIINMVEHNNSSRYNDNKVWKPGHLKKDCKAGNVGYKAHGSSTKGSEDGSSNSLKAFMSISKLNDSILWHARLGHVHFKRMQDMSQDGLSPAIDMDTEKSCNLLNRVPNKRNMITPYELWTKQKPNLNYLRVWGCRTAIRLPDQKLKSLGERGIECIFVGYAEHSGTRVEVSDQHSYCFNGEDDPKIFDKAMKSQYVAFWKEAITDEMDSIIGNNTWALTDLPPGCRPLGCKWIFKRKLKVDGTVEKFKARFCMKDMGEADLILVSTPLDTCEKLMPNRGLAVSQLEYSRVIGCLMYAMTCTRHDIAFAVGKLSRLVYSGYPLVLEGYTDASWISNTEDNSSISGWVFLLGGGVISWASKKQTCITGSIMKSKFLALAAVGKEAEWLKNLLFEIPLWVKPMAPISINCDSAAT